MDIDASLCWAGCLSSFPSPLPAQVPNTTRQGRKVHTLYGQELSAALRFRYSLFALFCKPQSRPSTHPSAPPPNTLSSVVALSLVRLRRRAFHHTPSILAVSSSERLNRTSPHHAHATIDVPSAAPLTPLHHNRPSTAKPKPSPRRHHRRWRCELRGQATRVPRSNDCGPRGSQAQGSS